MECVYRNPTMIEEVERGNRFGPGRSYIPKGRTTYKTLCRNPYVRPPQAYTNVRHGAVKPIPDKVEEGNCIVLGGRSGSRGVGWGWG